MSQQQRQAVEAEVAKWTGLYEEKMTGKEFNRAMYSQLQDMQLAAFIIQLEKSDEWLAARAGKSALDLLREVAKEMAQ